ncbi:hypothetical protein FRB95_005706 [Tulasnella sp. JGI-2019a]|nr:hypothetical protein FRB95_005706 [Tulasnella sp. JGI-2019a]
MSTPLLPGNLDRELNSVTSLRYRYALARVLYRGQEQQPDQPRRPGLPSELVLYIFRLCDLPRRDPSPALYFPWLQGRTVEDEEELYVTVSAWGPERQDRLWCTTPPLSMEYLEQIHKFRLRTLSKDQGWGGNPKTGSWSWFEIGILKRLAASEAPSQSPGEVAQTEVKVGGKGWGLSYSDSDQEAELNPLTGELLRWLSHNNDIAGREFKLYTGNDIGPEHELWDYLRPGDRLGVWMSARFGGWSCNGKHADIEVWERWEPSWM